MEWLIPEKAACPINYYSTDIAWLLFATENTCPLKTGFVYVDAIWALVWWFWLSFKMFFLNQKFF